MSSSSNSDPLMASLVLSLPTSVSHLLYYCEVQLLLALGWEGREQGGTTGSWKRELCIQGHLQRSRDLHQGTRKPQGDLTRRQARGRDIPPYSSPCLWSLGGACCSQNLTGSRGQEFPWCKFSSVTQLYLTLWDPMDCSMPGFPVLHQLSEIAQTQVHGVGDVIQPSHPLLCPSPPAFNPSCIKVFSMS